MQPIRTKPNKATPWTHYGWPKRVRDWRNVTCFTKRDMQSGLMRVPKGTEVQIRSTVHSRAVEMVAEQCQECGVSIMMSRISWRDLEVIDWPEALGD